MFHEVDPLKKNTIPILASILGKGSERNNLDLVCVLDVSGSMSGEKINLVKKTI